MPAFTFAAVPSSVIHADFIPILCECRDDYRIDLIDFKEKIKTADAVLISHMRGHTSDMDIILSECKQADIPLIEDAAHSLGTTWNGKKIGTIGDIGCFSFQSYKMLNSGEGGIFITDNPELFAKAVIMSGAYEHNWIKHQGDQVHFKKWQNKLPLYNLRINNLSAVLINAQLPELNRRIEKGRRNHDFTAERLNTSPWISVPEKLAPEERAPDSIQFNLINLDTDEIDLFEKITSQSGLNVQIFGRTKDNARAFWNWQFLPETFELPKTRKMLMSACDVRLPSRLTLDECTAISDVILSAISTIKSGVAA
jgi:dTDP-4-amino-4,6-dideoxygalactose transaminase